MPKLSQARRKPAWDTAVVQHKASTRPVLVCSGPEDKILPLVRRVPRACQADWTIWDMPTLSWSPGSTTPSSPRAESNNSRADPIVRTAASRRLPATAREAIGTGELRLRIYARHRKGGKVCWCGREETPFGFLIV